MKQQTRVLYEKMVDFKRFGTVLLAVGIFFYLGVIIPVEAKTELELNLMVLSSATFIAFSILFFIQAKQCQSKLLEMDDNEDSYN
ncbi:YrhC family protein [Neobacillus drentensis]|uniref:YrhC family protein n=1 Tax=Neobacillus drentensis TaxID=220684 RepID=UPI002FFFA3C6